MTDGFDQGRPTEPQPGDVPQKYCADRLLALEQDAPTKLHLAARLGIQSGVAVYDTLLWNCCGIG
jgi:hypothetical protein